MGGIGCAKKVKQTGGAKNLVCDHTSIPSGFWFPPNTNRYLLSTPLCPGSKHLTDVPDHSL